MFNLILACSFSVGLDAKISADGNIGTDSLLRPLLKSLGKTGELGQKGLRYAERLYTSSDDAFKIFNFEVELARRSKAYSKAGIKKTAEELDQEVAEIVKNTMPNYARVGEFVRASRMLPFGNFMSFPSEIFRTGTGIAQQILRDLRDPITGSLNPFTSTNIMKGTAMKRLVGSTITLGALPYGVTEGSKAIFGVSDEEAKAASDFVAPWAKDSQKIFMKNPDTDELYFIDWSKMNSYDTLQRPFATLLRNLQEGVDQEKPLMDGFIKGVAEAAGNIASPFVDPSIYTQAFLDVTIRGGMGYFTGGRPNVWMGGTFSNDGIGIQNANVSLCAHFQLPNVFAQHARSFAGDGGNGTGQRHFAVL